MDNYVVLDLETPNALNNSITSIAILIVEDNLVVKSIDQLINPESHFDKFNIDLTGISPEDVEDSPTFDEYWPKIMDYLTDNVIVGHNVKFDLLVISRTLDNYKMDIPEFDYYCTWKLSKKYLKLNSYRLSDIAKHIGFEYNSHIAIDDALASHTVFEHLNKKEDISIDNCGHYHYKLKFKEIYDEELAINLNYFYGMLYILKYYNHITTNHFDLIKDWHNKNKEYTDTTVFSNLNKQLNQLISKQEITNRDIEFLFKRTFPVTTSTIYDYATLLLGILQGMVQVIRVDNEIDLYKLELLYDWLLDNDTLKGNYFYDNILNNVKNLLDDGNISFKDKKELFEIFNELLSVNLDDC